MSNLYTDKNMNLPGIERNIVPIDYSQWGDNVSLPVLLAIAEACFNGMSMVYRKVYSFLLFFSVKRLKLDTQISHYFRKTYNLENKSQVIKDMFKVWRRAEEVGCFVGDD